MDNGGVHEVPTTPKELTKWVRDRLNELVQLHNSIEIKMGVQDIENQIEPLEGLTRRKNKEKPSIYLDKFLSVRQTGKILYFWSEDKSKWEYLAYMTQWLGLKVNSYLEYMMQNKDLILGYYDDYTQKYLNHKRRKIESFLESLTVGSCFLVFAILLFQNDPNRTDILKGSNTGDYFSQKYSSLCRDITNNQVEIMKKMLSLDFQIPWLAVEAIFSHSDLSKISGATSVDELAISCFDDLYPKANISKVQGGTLHPKGGFKHILHIFHWTRAPEGKWLVRAQSQQPDKSFRHIRMPAATDLLESATSFKRLDGSSMDVTYDTKFPSGLMQITPFHIFEYSKHLFMNLSRFEQNYLECGMPFTTYMACMIRLLETKEDVRLLGKNAIVRNTSTDQQEVLDFIIDMRKELSQVYACIPDDLNSLLKKLNDHHESKFSRDYAELKSYLCPNRWVLMAFIGSIILFVLTFIQTIYAMVDYYKS